MRVARKTQVMSVLAILSCRLATPLPDDKSAAPKEAECDPCESTVQFAPDGRTLVAVPAEDADADETIAWGRYFREYEATGWDRLEAGAADSAKFADEVQARAVGFIEGHFLADRIWNFWTNYRKNEFKTADQRPTDGLLKWMQQQEAFVRRGIEAGRRAAAGGGTLSVDSSYWRRMGLVMAQFDGMCEGLWAAARPGRNMSFWDLYILQSAGDLYDLMVLYPQHDNATAAPAERGIVQDDGQTAPEFPRRDYRPGHGVLGPDGYGGGELLECSALIKLRLEGSPGNVSSVPQHELRSRAGGAVSSQRRRALMHPQRMAPEMQPRPGAAQPDASAQLTDVWAGHATWRPYYTMLRTWKTYNLPWSASGPIAMSSSPGFLGFSKDDWYTTDRFVFMETTNGIYNKSLYNEITPACALMWQRAQVANLGASSGEEWVSLFSKHNSGTYNNQWMILDMNVLTSGAKEGALWVLEQLPGFIEAADLSHILFAQGFWASYNIPYFKTVYRMAGYPTDEDVHGSCPRAKIFAREQGLISSMHSFMQLMRLNKYDVDPLSNGNPADSVASRYDLEPMPGAPGEQTWVCRAFGAIDAKIVDLKAFRTHAVYAVNGPSAENQPVFSWADFCEHDPVSFATKRWKSNHSHVCDVSRIGLVDRFNFTWQYISTQAVL